MHHDHHEHDLGLAHDLEAINALASRRRALRWFAGAGAGALLTGCDGGSATGTIVAPTPSPSPSATPTPGATATPTPTAGCVADPTETNGPYPADGTNTSAGLTSNALTAANVVRSDLRPSFIGTSTTIAAGVQLTLTLTVVNVNASCAPLAGYAVYLWHCDRDGKYSLYDLPTESYLRGVQVTDSKGQVTFTTIFPGCYAGRYPHIHFEVFSSQANATSGRYAVLVSQLAMPAEACAAVYATSGYGTSQGNYASTSIARDNVFGDNTTAQMAVMTPTLTGSAAAGYTGSTTIGIAT